MRIKNRAGLEDPHLQGAFGLASPNRCAGSPHAARKPGFAPNPLQGPRVAPSSPLAGEGATHPFLSRRRERGYVLLPLPLAGEGGGEGEGRRTKTARVSPRTPGADRRSECPSGDASEGHASPRAPRWSISCERSACRTPDSQARLLHRRLGQLQHPGLVRHEVDAVAHRIQLRRRVQKHDVRLVMDITIHLSG